MSDFVRWYRSEKSNKTVALNTSLTELAILKLPSREQMEGLLRDHEATIIESIWTERLAVESRLIVDAFDE